MAATGARLDRSYSQLPVSVVEPGYSDIEVQCSQGRPVVTTLGKYFFFCKKGKQGLERSNNVVTLGIKREITLYMSLITSVKGSSLYWMSLLMRILPLPRWR